MTTNHTSAAVNEMHFQAQYALEHPMHIVQIEKIDLIKLRAVAEKYKRMEEAHEHIHHDDCHPSRYEEGTTECNAKRNRDDSHVCPFIWSEEALAFDPLSP